MNKLARSITKWTKVCDKRLCCLISYIYHTCEVEQHCHVGNTAKQRRLGLFQDSDIAGDLEDSKFTSGGTLCIFLEAIRLFPEARNKLLFHTTRRNLRISLLMQVYALDLWDLSLKCCILFPTNLRHPKIRCRKTCCATHHQENTPTTKLKLQFSTTILNYATSIVLLDVKSSQVGAMLYILKIMKR